MEATYILERIYQLRKERGWSEYLLSEKSGVPVSTISTWYRKKTCPTIPSLTRICNAYGITLAEFFIEPGMRLVANEEQQLLLHEFSILSDLQKQSVLKLLQSINVRGN